VAIPSIGTLIGVRVTVPQGYVEKFAHAEMTFKHQSTFDPATRREVCLEALPETSDFSTYPLIVLYS